MATALLEQPVAIRSRVAELQVRRTDIVFRNVAPGRVWLSVTVANVGQVRSERAIMTIQAAPLGAFVPWKDVGSLVVPPIEPDGYVEVSTELSAPRPARALGEFSRVPPGRLLTAVAGNDESEPRANAGSALGNMFLRLLGRPAPAQRTHELPDDPLQLLSRPNIHWAGNINVLIGRHAVERHLAQALRIYAGRTNLAVFFVGDRRDEYQFALTGSGAAWNAVLFDFTDRSTLAETASPAQAIPPSKWIPIDSRRMILLAICPPEGCQSGSVEVHVRQRSTGRDAVVEFSLDANAAGAGCYAV